MSQEFFCQICAITCTGQAPFEEHLKSTKHIRKSQGSVVVPSSPSQPISRLQSSPRASNMAEDSPSSSSTVISSDTMRILLEWNHPRGYKPYCEICHVHLHGEGNADRHFQSTNSLHYNKLADWETIRNGGILYSCKVCSDIFNDSGQMHDHFTSTIHQTMVEQKDLLEKFIRIYQTYDKLKQVHRENQDRLFTSQDNLSDTLQVLKITNEPEVKSKWKPSGLFNSDKLEEAMRRKIENDDD